MDISFRAAFLWERATKGRSPVGVSLPGTGRGEMFVLITGEAAYVRRPVLVMHQVNVFGPFVFVFSFCDSRT